MRVRERIDEQPVANAHMGVPSGLGARFRDQAERATRAGLDIAERNLSGNSEDVNRANSQLGGQ